MNFWSVLNSIGLSDLQLGFWYCWIQQEYGRPNGRHGAVQFGLRWTVLNQKTPQLWRVFLHVSGKSVSPPSCNSSPTNWNCTSNIYSIFHPAWQNVSALFLVYIGYGLDRLWVFQYQSMAWSHSRPLCWTSLCASWARRLLFRRSVALFSSLASCSNNKKLGDPTNHLWNLVKHKLNQTGVLYAHEPCSNITTYTIQPHKTPKNFTPPGTGGVHLHLCQVPSVERASEKILAWAVRASKCWCYARLEDEKTTGHWS